MSDPARHEIEKHAKNEFAVAQERLAAKQAKKWRRVLLQIAARGNSGGYVGALTECKARHVRHQTIALADAYARTFDFFGVPSDLESERSLEVGAQQIAAGSISAIRGELDLIQTRTRMSLPNGGGIHREIQGSMQSGVNAGKLRLRRQRIKFKDLQSPTRLVQFALNPAEKVTDAAEGMWYEYRAWFSARVESLEAMAARTDPKHFPEDEQDAQRFPMTATSRRFDEVAEVEYRQWLESGSRHDTFTNKLIELRAQVIRASLALWGLGSKVLKQWYERDCQPRIDSALSSRVIRWEHRARTTEFVHHISRDRGLALAGIIGRLDRLTAEEPLEIPSSEGPRRLRVWIHATSHHFEGGHSGDFLERVRSTITGVGRQLSPPPDISPLDYCLRMLLRELVCEREPVNHPQIDRLDNEQLSRYLWAPYFGNSITPEGGQVLNLCEALKWYCQRLIGLLDLPYAGNHGAPTSAKRRGRRPNQDRREAIHNAIARHGDEWRDHLGDIFKELDGKEVPLGDFQAREIDLGDGESTKVSKWDDLDLACGEQRRQIIDVLRKYAD